MTLPAHAMLLAAGLGSRIRAAAGDRPKPLIEINGQPVLAYNLRWLREEGVRSLWINLHYGPEDVRAAVERWRPRDLEVHFSEEPELLGTAGAAARLRTEWDGPLLLVYGDSLVRFPLAPFAEAHSASGAEATIALFDQHHNAHSGIAGGRVLLDADGRVREFAEGRDHPSTLVNAGVYILEPSVLNLVTATGVADFGRDVFPAMLATGRPMHGFVIDGYCVGIDTPEGLERARALVAAGTVALS